MKLHRLYCFGDQKTFKNSSAFINKLSNRSLLFEETSIQAKIFLEAFKKVMFLPGDWHTGMNMLQSIYKLFWTDLLKPLRDLLGWKRISKDIQSCYYQVSRLVKYTNDVVLAYLLRAYVFCCVSTYEDCIDEGPPGNLLCALVFDFQKFLRDALDQSANDHLKLIVNFLLVSSNFLDFVSAFLFTSEISVLQVLAHLEPYLQIQRNLVKELTSMTPQTNNSCRKLRVSAF